MFGTLSVILHISFIHYIYYILHRIFTLFIYYTLYRLFTTTALLFHSFAKLANLNSYEWMTMRAIRWARMRSRDREQVMLPV